MATDRQKLIEELLANVQDPKELLGPTGLLRDLKKAVMERVLDAEMDVHLGYEKHDASGCNTGNSRNGHNRKTVLIGDGKVVVDVPRDRNGTFEPKLVSKHQRRLTDFDDKVLSLYARGMSMRDIQSHLEELYDVDVSHELISRATQVVLEQVAEWQGRPLAEVWPIVYVDALVVKVRDSGHVRKKSLYIVLGVNTEGRKEVLGLWMADTEGARFWLQVLTDLKSRGVQDVLILCCDGLKVLSEVVDTVFPHTTVQTCVVHMVRYSLSCVAWQARRKVSASLRCIYTAPTLEQASAELDAFEREWGQQFPSIVRSWRTNWEHLTAFYAFDAEIRRVIYTTNAIESLNRQVRKMLKTRGSLPNEDATMKLVWLALNQASKTWSYPIKRWDLAMQKLDIHFEGRLGL